VTQLVLGIDLDGSSQRPFVTVVDDDESIRESLPALLRESGYEVRSFASAEEFLASDSVVRTRCLVLDVGLQGMSGPELQRELARRGAGMPIIFITGRLDRMLRQRLLQQGATECLFKPFGDAALLGALRAAIP
jgi:FixJ family two-component response regulator